MVPHITSRAKDLELRNRRGQNTKVIWSRADSHHRTESLLQQKNDAEVGNANHVHRGEEHSHNKHKMHHTRSSRGTENAEALSEERRSIRGQHAKCCKCVGESSRGIWSYSGECQDQCKVRFATEKVDQHIKKATPGCDPTPKEFENFTDKEKQLCEAACVDKFNGETDEQIAEKFAKGSESNANDANTKTDGKEPLEMPKFNLAGKGEQQSNNNNNNDEATTTPPLQIKKSTAVSMTVLSMMAIVPVLATIARNTLSA